MFSISAYMAKRTASLVSSKRVSQKQKHKYISPSQFTSCYFLTFTLFLTKKRKEKSFFYLQRMYQVQIVPQTKQKTQTLSGFESFKASCQEPVLIWSLSKSAHKILSRCEFSRREALYSQQVWIDLDTFE